MIADDRALEAVFCTLVSFHCVVVADCDKIKLSNYYYRKGKVCEDFLIISWTD